MTILKCKNGHELEEDYACTSSCWGYGCGYGDIKILRCATDDLDCEEDFYTLEGVLVKHV